MNRLAQRPHWRRLAWLALCLLVFTPTAHRLLAPGGAMGGTERWASLCTVAGLKLVRLAPGPNELAAPVPAGDTGAGPDCEYCPLLQAVLALSLAWLGLAEPSRRGRLLDWRTRWAPRFTRPCGLGSRGPPPAA